MGNSNCVAGGGAPNRCDFVIINSTDFPLALDQNEDCGLVCEHKGFQLTSGKILYGFEPPEIIAPQSMGRFSASGREGSLIAPEGKAFYRNVPFNLNLLICWKHAGLSTVNHHSFTAIISGKPSHKAAAALSCSPLPWSELLIAECDPENWCLTVKHKI